MGYDIEMQDREGNTLEVEPFKAGGIHTLEGTNKAEISITYNYAWFFYKFMDKEKGIRIIYNKTGKEAKTILKKAIDELCTKGMGNGRDQTENYWNPTPSNVTKVLEALLSWCDKHPEGIFRGD